ncbi:MAG: Gfo/Idh/MocA family oxidoreductase [Chloroflexota bacterium]
MDKPFGAAVVGLGVGRSHAAAYASLPESALVAVCDTNPERLGPVAEHYAAAASASVDALLRDERVEVISIATPHPTHAALAIQAMEAGRHVIVEKPMAVDLREADAMIACAQRAGRTLARILQHAVAPLLQTGKKVIACKTRAFCISPTWTGSA